MATVLPESTAAPAQAPRPFWPGLLREQAAYLRFASASAVGGITVSRPCAATALELDDIRRLAAGVAAAFNLTAQVDTAGHTVAVRFARR